MLKMEKKLKKNWKFFYKKQNKTGVKYSWGGA